MSTNDNIQARPYQGDACREVLAALRDVSRLLYVLPTGAGKTVVLGWLVQQWARAGRRVLYLVHTAELIEQTHRVLTTGYGLSRGEVGVVRGSDRRVVPGASVQIATVQTLIARGHHPAANVVIVDEAHHAPAQTWSEILGWYGDAKVLGVTATPDRLDGTPLGCVFEKMIVGARIGQLIDDGWLRRPRCFVGFRVNRAGQRVAATRGRTMAGDVLRTLRLHAQDRNGIVFASSIEHAKRLVEELALGRYSTKYLTGETPGRERRALLQPGGWLDRGTRRLAVTCDVLNEGYDLPSLKLAVLAHRTMSQTKYLHQVGRIMRPCTTKEGLEWAPLVIDHGGSVLRFGLPHEDRTWRLDGAVSATDDSGPGDQGSIAPGSHWKPGGSPRAKACSVCGEIAPVEAAVCANASCATPFPRQRVPRHNAAIELQEIEPATAEQRAAFEQRWYERSVARRMEAGQSREQAEEKAREYAKRATEMWFGKTAEEAAAQ